MVVGTSIASPLLASERAGGPGVNSRCVGGTARRSAVPLRRPAMVLRPEREMRATLEVVRAWAVDSDVMLASLEDDPPLPADCDRIGVPSAAR